jgi:hypothetical protein
MTDSRELDWAELEARALRLLEHPKDLEPRDPIRSYGSLLRLWHFPAFGLQRTWTILAPGRKAPPDAPPMVREVAWDREADSRRASQLSEARPTLGLRDALLPAAGLGQLLDDGARLAVPVVGFSERVGVDGEYFGVETYETSPFVRLQWWGAGPAEWRHFTDWVAQLRAFVQRHLAASG